MSNETNKTEAERQLIELVRGEGEPNFTLTIVCYGGKWTVATTIHGDGYFSGDGASFAEAWHGQTRPLPTEEAAKDPSILSGRGRPNLKPSGLNAQPSHSGGFLLPRPFILSGAKGARLPR